MIAKKVAEFNRRIIKLNDRLIYSIRQEYPVYTTDKLILICENGHERELSVRNAIIGGCLTCWRKKIKVDDLKLLAESKGGECLSKEYKNTNTQYFWRCEKGHVWASTRHTVVDHWCPSCASTKRNIRRYKGDYDKAQ